MIRCHFIAFYAYFSFLFFMYSFFFTTSENVSPSYKMFRFCCYLKLLDWTLDVVSVLKTARRRFFTTFSPTSSFTPSAVSLADFHQTGLFWFWSAPSRPHSGTRRLQIRKRKSLDAPPQKQQNNNIQFCLFVCLSVEHDEEENFPPSMMRFN